MAINAVYRAVSFKVRQYAALPWLVFDLDPKTGKRVSQRRGDWLHRLLTMRPNAFQSPYEFWTTMGYQLELTGAAFAPITRNVGRTEVLSLMPVTTSSVEADIRSDTEIVYHVTGDDGRRITYPQERMLHIRGIHSDILHPVSPVAAMRLTLETGSALTVHRHAAFSKNGINTNAYLKQEGTVDLSNELTQRYLKLFNRRATGPKVSASVPVIPKGFELITNKMSLADLQFIQTEQLTQHEIFGIWSVPPSLLGEEDQAKYATAQAAAHAFVKFCLRPVIAQLEQAVERDVMGTKMRLSTDLVMDTTELLRGDNAAQATYWQGLTTAGIASRNEARLGLGMMESEQAGADDLMVQSQNVPLEQPQETPSNEDIQTEADELAAAAGLRIVQEGI